MASRLFLKCLGGIYFLALISLWMQLNGLFGTEGISSIASLITRLSTLNLSFFEVPTLFWFGTSQAWLVSVCLLGIIASLGLMMGLFPWISAFCAWLSYMSFVSVGAPFLSFQWDVLLLECGFLSLFLAPMCVRNKRHTYAEPSKWVVIAFQFLLFRLMFASGIVKWQSGDELWRQFDALSVHYMTQPLPHIISWWAHQLPAWFHKLSVGWMFLIECIILFLYGVVADLDN